MSEDTENRLVDKLVMKLEERIAHKEFVPSEVLGKLKDEVRGDLKEMINKFNAFLIVAEGEKTKNETTRTDVEKLKKFKNVTVSRVMSGGFLIIISLVGTLYLTLK